MLRRLVMSLMLEKTQAVWILLLGILWNQALSSDFVKRFPLAYNMGFPCGSDGKNLPTMQETWVPSLGWENPLENGMATCSSILAWRVPWTEVGSCLENSMDRGGLQFLHPRESDTTEWPSLSLHLPVTDYSTQDSALWISTASITKRHFPFLPKRSLPVIRATWVHGAPRQGLRGGRWPEIMRLWKPLPCLLLPFLTHAGLSNIMDVSFFNIYFYLFSWLCQVLIVAHRIFDLRFSMWILSCGLWDLFPWPGIEPRPPAIGALSLNHWTTREVPYGWVSWYRNLFNTSGYGPRPSTVLAQGCKHKSDLGSKVRR